MPPPPKKALWLTPSRVARLRQALSDGDATLQALHAAARATALSDTAAAEESGSEAIVATAVRAWLESDRALAQTAQRAWRHLADRMRERGNLSRADCALAGAAVRDATLELAPEEDRAETERRLRALADGFREPDLAHGDPHHVVNNHWGVSHAAAAVAAMAADDGTAASVERIAWARGRVRAFLRQHGEAGLYHEGLGYQLYAAAFWLPFLRAARGYDGVDECAALPSLPHAAALLYACAVPSPPDADGTRRQGRMLSWNDAGTDWCDSGAAVLLTALAPARLRGALRAQFDRLNGIAGDRRFGPRHAGLFFTLADYPFDVPARAPARTLPRWQVDNRQGLVVVRNRYRDADDAVLGGYARCAHPGGHAQDDAGSLRCTALGHDWIAGGGQNRACAAWQSLLTPADGQRPRPYACGALLWCAPAVDGGVFAFDLRRACGAYAERWVAVRYGRAATDLAVLDLLDDHTPRDWHWNLTFGSDLAFRAHADGLGFELEAGDGARLSSRFLGQAPAGLELLRMPDSARTFQDGVRETYPGRPFVRAWLPNRPHRAVYWVARIRRGTAGAIRGACAEGLAVTIDEAPWERPFGVGLATAFDPRRGGTTSRYPRGVPD